MQQLNSVQLLLKKKKRQNKTQAGHHEANLIELQCDFNSDLKEYDLFSTFKYQVLSADSSDLTTVSQKSQSKQEWEHSHEILKQKTKITKQWAQRKQNLSTSKTLWSDKWQTSQVVISDTQHNKLSMNENSDESMNENKKDSRSKVRFLDSESVEKTCNASNMFKIKSVKLTDVLWQMTEQNSTQVMQKMLWAVMSDITVENILTLRLMTHKLMFKSDKSDIIFKISETEKININSLQTFLLFNVLYSFISLKAIVKIEEGQVSALIDNNTKVNLVEEHILQKLNVFYTVDGCLWLIDINDQKTVLCDICENIEIQIDSIKVLQFLLIVEKVS